MAVDSSCEVVCNGKFAAEDREGRSVKEQWVQLQLVKGRLMLPSSPRLVDSCDRIKIFCYCWSGLRDFDHLALHFVNNLP